LQGFKTVERRSVTVNVTQTPVLDITLEVGDQTTSVDVIAEAPLIQTASAALGTLVDNKTITSVPLTTRNYTQVLSLSAGVVAPVANAVNLGRGSIDMNVNGQDFRANNYQVDGADANSWSYQSSTEIFGAQWGGIAVPNPDAISEFKVQTAQYDAGYGRNTGANVNVVTKSGSSSFRGSMFEFLRDTSLNANDFFLKATGRPRGVMDQHQFGGALGGPIVKERLFFFGSYQDTRQKNGLFTQSSSSAFASAILPPLNDGNRTAAALGALYCNQPTFAGGVHVACDGSNINPVALQIVQAKLPDGSYLIPNPQTILTTGPNAGQGFSAFSIPGDFKEKQFIANLDYVVSRTHMLTEKFFYARAPVTRPFLAQLAGPGNTPGFPSDETTENYVSSVRLTSILRSNLVNQVHASYNRNNSWGSLRNLDYLRSDKWGMTPINPLTFPYIPALMIGGFGIFGGTSSDTLGYAHNLRVEDQMSWSRGRNSVRFGGVLEQFKAQFTIPGRSRGEIRFQTFQDFLLGMNASQNQSPIGQSNVFSTFYQIVSGVADNRGFTGTMPYGALFVQDDVKVASRLTLNAGLRWEYIGDLAEVDGRTGAVFYDLMKAVPIPPPAGSLAGFTVPNNFNPQEINPATGRPFGLPEGVTVRSSDGIWGNVPKNSLGPRLGFAWQPFQGDNPFVLRGGYGITYQVLAVIQQGTPVVTSPPFGLGPTFVGVANAGASLQTPDPGGVLPLGFAPRTSTGVRVDSAYAGQRRNPMLQSWNVNLQYGWKSWGLEVGYLANRGSDILVSVPMNQAQLASASNPVNCGFDGNPANCIVTNTPANAPLRVPVLGEAATALATLSYTGKSRYHALQMAGRKRLSHGMRLEAAYTWGKSEDNLVFFNDVTNLDAQWGRSPWDRTHRLVVNYTLELPGPFASGMGAKLLSGWSISGVTTAQTGVPLTLTDPRAGSVYGRSGQATITLCQGMTEADLTNAAGSVEDRLNNWFNLSAICAPPAIGSGTGYGNTARNIVDGPGNLNFDMVLVKTITVGGLSERAELQFRAELYNAFNHPQFGNPGTVFGTPTFGVITSTSNSPRLLQFGLKYLF
jgi:hypothetical protein